MKKITLLLLCVAFGGTIFAQRLMKKNEFVARSEYSIVGNKDVKTVSNHVAKVNSERNPYRAAREKAYEWNTKRNKWELYAIRDIVYDAFGNERRETFSLQEGVPFEESTYRYDANNQIVEKITQKADGSVLVNSEKKVFKYDEIVTNFSTLKETYNWNDATQKWELGYDAYKRPVIRDAQGRVIYFSVSVPYMGAYSETFRTTISYDNVSNKAATYLYESLQYRASDKSYYWQKEFDLRDIEWENTDGQILKEWRELILGNNRVKKATYYWNGKIDGYMLVDYVEDKRDFHVRDTYSDINVIGQEHTLETLDDNGSYREDIYEYFGEYANGNTYHKWAITTCNEHGDIVDYIEYEQIGSGEQKTMCHNKFEYKYDETTGVMTEMVQTDLDTSTGNYNKTFKIEYSNIVNTGIDDVFANQQLTYRLSDNALNISMQGLSEYVIYNTTGLVVASGKAADFAAVDVSAFASGVYMLKATGAAGTEVVKFVRK